MDYFISKLRVRADRPKKGIKTQPKQLSSRISELKCTTILLK